MLIFLFVFWLYKQEQHLRIPLISGFILKVAAGIGLGMLYKYYYSGDDTWLYWEEANRYLSLSKQSIGDFFNELISGPASIDSSFVNRPRAIFFSKLIAVLAFITQGDYWIVSIYCSLFSFLGIWYLLIVLHRITPNSLAIYISLLAFPSVVFWGSGVLKESFFLGALCFILAVFLKFYYQKEKVNWWELLGAIASFIILWKLKYYFAGLLVLTMLPLAIQQQVVRQEKLGKRILIFAGSVTLLLVLVMNLHPNFGLDRLFMVISKNYENLITKSEPNHVVIYEGLTANGWSMLRHVPKALFTGLFRPIIGDYTGNLSVLAIVENCVLLILTATSIKSLSRKTGNKEVMLYLAGFIYCFLCAIFIALSTPNFGSLVRFKLGYLPVFLLLITLPNPWIKKINQWLFDK